jgi:hypothetical protein
MPSTAAAISAAKHVVLWMMIVMMIIENVMTATML